MRARTAVAVVLVGAVGYLTSQAGGQTGGQPARQPPPVAPRIPEPKKAKLEPLDRTELDKRIARVVNEAVQSGVVVWNNEAVPRDVRVEGAFRLYQGTLAAVVPLLDHRPELQKVSQYRLKQGSGQRAEDGAFLLREALDDIQKETAPALVVKPLWERLGGEPVVRAVVKDFVETAARDPKANLSRGGMYKLDKDDLATLNDRLVTGLSQLLKGPLPYSGGVVYADVIGLQLTKAEYDVLSAHLLAAMKKNKVPDAEVAELKKFIDGMRAYPGLLK